MKILIMVDMQNDFISGTLGNSEAQTILPRVCKKVREFIAKNPSDFFYTMDTHNENYLDTIEGKKLPVPHCIKGTIGWELPVELNEIVKNLPEKCRIEKNTFGADKLPEAIKCFENVEEIELIGVCTDICVISNAILLKAFFPEVKIVVNGSCCAGTSAESHSRALEAMKMCHIDIV